MTASANVYFKDNTMLLRVSELTNVLTGFALTAGTVTAQLSVKATGATIGSPAALTYNVVTGNWDGIFPSDASVVIGKDVVVTLTIDGGSTSARGKLKLTAPVEERTADC